MTGDETVRPHRTVRLLLSLGHFALAVLRMFRRRR